jgi:hypothetical protein
MIKRFLVTTALLAATALPLRAAETFLVVKQNGYDGEDTYEVMTQVDFKEAERALRDETKHVRKALDLAKKAWRDDPEHKNMFPTSGVSPRKMRAVAKYKDQASASEKCSTYVERMEKSKAEKEKDKGRSRGRRGGNKEREAEKAQREKEREAERKALQEEARSLFERFLDELKAAAKAKAAGK